jgi:hypothetical protein
MADDDCHQTARRSLRDIDRRHPSHVRDPKPLAIESAEFLKRKNPHGVVVVKDLQTGEKIVVVD